MFVCLIIIVLFFVATTRTHSKEHCTLRNMLRLVFFHEIIVKNAHSNKNRYVILHLLFRSSFEKFLGLLSVAVNGFRIFPLKGYSHLC